MFWGNENLLYCTESENKMFKYAVSSFLFYCSWYLCKGKHIISDFYFFLSVYGLYYSGFVHFPLFTWIFSSHSPRYQVYLYFGRGPNNDFVYQLVNYKIWSLPKSQKSKKSGFMMMLFSLYLNISLFSFFCQDSIFLPPTPTFLLWYYFFLSFVF